LYVNAISYRGLLDAASLADRLGQTEEASRWRVTARRIKAAWDHAFRLPDLRNERTFSAGFWPSAMPDTPLHTLHRYLDLRWKQRRTPDGAFQQWPVWPAFELAEAHQWLAVGTPDRAWKTVEWFWQHQVSPGLYTWWEGEGMPVSEWKDASHRGTYSFTRWRQVRGWTDPPHVTPQYWVAAQMVLLQLDMLAMLDRSTNPPTILLGAGLPKNWVDRPHRVGGFPIPGGLLDWRWDRHTLHARITGQTPLQVRPGPPFPAGTVVTIEHSRTAFKN
jgi:GH15 family glucan-1,4-alpha-glucosidase